MEKLERFLGASFTAVFIITGVALAIGALFTGRFYLLLFGAACCILAWLIASETADDLTGQRTENEDD